MDYKYQIPFNSRFACPPVNMAAGVQFAGVAYVADVFNMIWYRMHISMIELTIAGQDAFTAGNLNMNQGAMEFTAQFNGLMHSDNPFLLLVPSAAPFAENKDIYIWQPFCTTEQYLVDWDFFPDVPAANLFLGILINYYLQAALAVGATIFSGFRLIGSYQLKPD
jgi:hypothetical protein